MRILLTGGGTMGSVSPLLAIAEELDVRFQMSDFKCQISNVRCQILDVRWLGTKNGPEKRIIEKYQIPFQSIFAGKLRRYFDWRNFIDPIFIFLGFVQSFFVLLKFKPDIILSAGSFVSLPVIWAGWFLKIPSLIHQLDIKPTLTNRLSAPFTKRVTVTFEKSLKDFPQDKTIWTGNPVRKDLRFKIQDLRMEKVKKFFNLEKKLPTVLVTGGGTGAAELNKIIVKALPELTKFCQVIHLTGGKNKSRIKNQELWNKRYHEYDFLIDKMKHTYAAADLVICRAGIGTLTELAALAKPAILIPLPDSHQEENAKFFQENKAAIMFSQKELSSKKLAEIIKETLNNQEKIQSLSKNIQKLNKPNAAEKIVDEIFAVLHISQLNK